MKTNKGVQVQGTDMVFEAAPAKKRGFGSMDPKRVAEIASMGGTAAHKKGTAHEFDSEAGRRASKMRGKKNGI